VHRLEQEARESASPSGVDGSDRAGPRVCDEDREAVGSLHCKSGPFQVGRERITFGAIPMTRDFLYDMNSIRMNLTQNEQLLGLELERTKKTAAILFHTFERIPGNVAKIEGVIGESADPTVASGEPVTHVRKFFKGTTAVIGHSPRHSPDKSVFIHASNSEACLCLMSTRFWSIA
jgi:hypothetical protein